MREDAIPYSSVTDSKIKARADADRPSTVASSSALRHFQITDDDACKRRYAAAALRLLTPLDRRGEERSGRTSVSTPGLYSSEKVRESTKWRDLFGAAPFFCLPIFPWSREWMRDYEDLMQGWLAFGTSSFCMYTI